MAEALAVVGLVSAIVQFVDFGGKLVERLNEFNSDTHEVPETFRTIKLQLPLLIDTLRRTQQQASAGHVSGETATTLKPLIDACFTEINALQARLDKTLPPHKSSSWQRRLLALKSLAHDKEVERSMVKLESHIRLLTFYQSTSNSDSSNKLLALQQTMAVSQQPRRSVFMVPFDRDETFVGREDILDSIDQRLNSPRRRAVLSGIGGVGKSQIAIQYCYKYKSKHLDSHILWVHCGSVARFEQGYKEIARKLKVPGTQDPDTDLVKAVFDWLSDEDNGSWLLVLDNADDQEIFFGSARRPQSHDILQQGLGMLAQYLPRGTHGSTLVTTRDRRVGERFAERDKPIVVLPLKAVEATSMLHARLPNQNWVAAEVAELLENLQYLPLAIAQAASYISEEGVTIARYLELLRPGNTDSKVLLEQDYYDARRHPDIQNSVFQSWKISFDQIRQQAPRAAEILSLMSVLDKQSIPARMLHEEESLVVFDKALGTLKNFSLIQEERTQNTYGIHRLVQLCTQWWLEQEEMLTRWQEKALEVLLSHCPSSAGVENWKAWESISPHITIVRGYHFKGRHRKLRHADITSQMGRYYEKLGRYDVALKMEEDALNVRKELLGQDHPSTLASMNNVAEVLSDQGRYEQAEEMHRQVLELRQRVLGRENPHTLESMDNLAGALGDQGKYEPAEDMHQQVLILREAVLGQDHPDTLTSMNNLANVLGDQGKYEQAEEMHRQSLRLRETGLGKEHPDTLTSMNNLANVLGDQGRYEQAEEMHRQALKLRETTLGQEHPSTLTSMNNLALVLSRQGKYELAEEMHRQALRLRQTMLGQNHPDTLASMSNLANVLGCRGKYEPAEEMHRQVLKQREVGLGKEHPDTLTSMNNLANMLSRQGKYEQAEEMHRQALRLRETTLGQEHPSMLTSMNNLALVLTRQSKYKQAEEIYRQALRLRQTVLGQDHPDSLMSMSNLASVLSDQGKHEQAEAMHRQVLGLMETGLGKEHPSTLTSMNNLAEVLSDQGKYEQAEEMHRQVLRLRETVLGQEHPDTLASMANLASTCWNQDRWNEAEKLERQVMETRKTVLGYRHPATLRAMANLAHTWKSQGRDQEAIDLMKQAESLQREILGIDHPETLACLEAVESWQAVAAKGSAELPLISG